uniref:GTPase RsgA n=1 Tax=Escherichia coli TaxID=562 RepID=UPI002B24998A
VLARRQTLTRAVTRGRRKEEQLLAANLDTVLVMTTQADWDTERLGRYLQAVSLSGAAPVILLNKADELRGEFLPWAREQLQAQDLATPLLPISAAAGTGLEALGEILRPAQTAALIGSSGMGKSTLT